MPRIPDFIPKPPICNICNKPVETKTAVTDQDGKAVHEECYVLKLRLKDATKPPEQDK